MRRFMQLLLSLSLVLSSLFVFVSAAGAESKFKITEDPVIAERVKAFADIKAMFTDKPDLAAIKKFYVEKFQTEVKRVEAVIKADDPKIDASIMLVVDSAIKGDLPAGSAKQAIDKGLQWYFYFALRDLISTVVRPAMTSGDLAAATKGFDKVIQLYEGVLLSTVEKRDLKYSIDMVSTLKGNLEQLQADIAGGKTDDFNAHRQILDKTLIKTYALATYTYAESIPTKAPADLPAAITEGYFLYMPVYTYLRGGGTAEANLILNAFANADMTKLNKQTIGDALQLTMVGKVNEYFKQVSTKLEAGDLPGARGYVMEGLMFLSTQEVFFGPDKYKAILTLAEQFIQAVDNKNLAEAERIGFQLLTYNAEKEGIQLKLNSVDYKVDGKAAVAENAPFLSLETSRTLAPVRLIAEALKAVVSYDDATQTVKIAKDGKTTELVVGSADVIQDGIVNDKVKLDQPVLIQNGSSFIPLRAITELFGKRVFYYDGSIIVGR
ncbi:stalk domain-containing protein [Paenibacillus koleovorans]|uniref:stalk domain-containing protein n=1 Tax=Paenibacillus koleovorans TaxID=121608 RepID=UPI000FD990C2|nr:stalk domain-containing protein [Paenibacillus koleovorans]